MKRLTDTEKWDDPWFDALSNAEKNIWSFICDKCDIAGVWKFNLKTLKNKIDPKITIDSFNKILDGRILWLSPEKVFIIRFVNFQNGDISKGDAQIFIAIRKMLLYHGITLERYIEIQTEYEKKFKTVGSQWDHDPTPIPSSKGLVKDKDKDRDLQELDEIQKFIAERCPNVQRMAAQLKDGESNKLLKKFPRELLFSKLAAMENMVGLTKKYRSVYFTLNQWCNMAIESGRAIGMGENSKAGELDKMVSQYYAILNSYPGQDPDKVIESMKISKEQEIKIRKVLKI